MRKEGARLYWHPSRKSWIIRDGAFYQRTGCGIKEHARAEKLLGDYIATKSAPEPSPSPLLADILREYANYREGEKEWIANLTEFWAALDVSTITPRLCRDYAKKRPAASARRELSCLRAAIRHWHKEITPIAQLPAIVVPGPGQARERVLSRSEMAALLWQARRIPHLARFIIFGYYSGTRSGAMLRSKWSWVDFQRGIIRRREEGEPEKKNKRAPRFRASNRLLAHLKRWHRLDHGKGFIIHYRGGPVTEVRHAWANACERAKIEDATPHVLRHTRVSHLLSMDVSVWETANSVGMSAEMVERVYGHLTPEWQKKAAGF